VLRPATRWSLAGRLVLLVLGAAGLASGCFVVLSEQDGTATAALIGISALLLFAAAFGDRIASVRHGDTEVKLLLEGARDAAARGDDSAHDALLRAAVEVAQASVGLAPDVRVSDERLVHDLQVVNRLNEMEELRGRIDVIDEQLVRLLNVRVACAVEVGRLKHEAGLPIYQPDREKAVLARVQELNRGPLGQAAVQRLFERIIDESRRLERIGGEGEGAGTGAADAGGPGAKKEGGE